MDKTLEQLLGSKARIRVLRLFFHSPKEFFALKELTTKTKLRQPLVRKELTALKQIGFLQTKFVTIGKNRRRASASPKRVLATRRRELWGANQEFPLWNELRALVLKSSDGLLSGITSEIKKLGAVKLAVLGGVFVDQANARADMLIVLGRPSQRKLNNFISNLEAESGREINCVVVTPAEFKYRYSLYDRVVRDMLSSKNVRVINKLTL